MAVRRIKGRWVIEFMQAGHRVFKRLPEEASRQDALDYETKLRREIFDQATLGKRPEIGLEYAIREWLREVNSGRKSERASESHANHAIRASEGLSAVGVGFATCANSLKSGVGKTISAATANRRLCILKAVAKYAWRKGWTEENLSARIQLLPENNARNIHLSSGQALALLDAATGASKAFIAWGIYTGMRAGEILALEPADIAGETIRVRDSKTGEPRNIPKVSQLRVFEAAIPFKLHRRTLYAGFESARAAIGMPHLRFHDLRHTTASLMIQAGVHLYTVGEILGHKSAQTTRRYAHLTEGNKREALELAFSPSQLQQAPENARQPFDPVAVSDHSPKA
jgi:integrase